MTALYIISAILAAFLLHCAAVIAAASAVAERNTASVPCDVLIILGSRVDGDTPRADLRARIDAAAEYLKKYPSCIAIGTGGNFRAEQTVSEAQAIKNGLVADGIEPSRVLLEDKARTTYENFLNCKKIIEKDAPEKRLCRHTFEYLSPVSCGTYSAGLGSRKIQPHPRAVADSLARISARERGCLRGLGQKNQTGFFKEMISHHAGEHQRLLNAFIYVFEVARRQGILALSQLKRERRYPKRLRRPVLKARVRGKPRVFYESITA